MNKSQGRKRYGFTLVELLVVIGIIALLISMLMPALASSRRQAVSVACRANLKTNYTFMLMYANENRGWWAPPGKGYTANQSPGDPKYVAEEDRWPAHVFKPAIWNPPTMLCPNDPSPMIGHSYILNNYCLDLDDPIKMGKHGGKRGKTSPSDIILMGEKKSDNGDYYMEPNDNDFQTKVEQFRHGISVGSNYLYCDGSVRPQLPKEARAGIDPWNPFATTQPVAPNPPAGP